MTDSNPYVTVNGPDYAGGLMNWQQLFGNQQQARGLAKPMPNATPQLSPDEARGLAKPMPNAMGPAQMRGLGQTLQQWLNPRQPQNAPGPQGQSQPATFADRFNAAYPAQNSGNWAGGWDVNG